MRNRFQRINSIFHFIGSLLIVLGIILLLPTLLVSLFWGSRGDGWQTLLAFLVPAGLSFALGFTFRKLFKFSPIDMTSSMLICALGWIFASALGALPFVIGIKSSYLNAYFEAMSGFTTTGITVYSGLENLPHSILFWRSVIQWLGGLGILSLFLALVFKGKGVHHIYGAESHKISSSRPTPGLFSTLKILWEIYILFTLFAAFVLILEKMPVFDAFCHSLTTLSTGGFSPYDASIDYYRISGHPNYKLIEYTVTFLMMLGGINFLVHYRVLTGKFKALWDSTEVRYWWTFIIGFTVIIMFEHLLKSGLLAEIFKPARIEETFRYGIFQVVSVMTTTGFGTKDIGADYFGAASRQLFLVMMVIGGCVGSTGGGFKVLRIAILKKLTSREIFRLRVSKNTSQKLVIDKNIISNDEIHRVGCLFFTWIALIIVGGAVTALFSTHGPWQSLSGMFSAVGNIGPCYISVDSIIKIHPVVKITYIFGMLAGRLEILPVLLLFSRKAWV